ncbi:MAG: Sec-independent protein translocase protein TatB [Hoeflea sp.]|nr:Sec-independent protein translocase protein TatB [Hoeflea sp.]
MFDIGWPELLVVAIVLIIVVGPKDLPPMLRAFGRTTKKLRGMANEFRGQFDEALREAELDDVKKTFDEARKLNPMQTIRDAVNPLKDTAKTIRSDLEKTVNAPVATPPVAPKTELPAAAMKLPEGPPEIKPAISKPDPKAAATPAPASGLGAAAGKPVAAAKPSKTSAPAKTRTAPTQPAAGAKPAPAKTATAAAASAAPAKAAPAAKAPPAPAAKPKSAAATTKAPAAAKPAPRARKPKQGEGQA